MYQKGLKERKTTLFYWIRDFLFVLTLCAENLFNESVERFGRTQCFE